MSAGTARLWEKKRGSQTLLKRNRQGYDFGYDAGGVFLWKKKHPSRALPKEINKEEDTIF